MTPLLVIWYVAGLYIIALIGVEVARHARAARADERRVEWGRLAVVVLLPTLIGAALFAIWPLVAWALARNAQ